MAAETALFAQANQKCQARRLLVGRATGANGVDNDLDSSPARVRVCAKLLAYSQGLELGIVKTEIADEIGAHYRGASLRQDQVFLGLSGHAGINDHHGNPELIASKKLPGGAQRILIL